MKCSAYFFKRLLFLSSSEKHEHMREIFSDLHWENPMGLPEVKHTKVWGPLQDWTPLEFFTLNFVHVGPPAVISYGLGFSTCVLILKEFLAPWPLLQLVLVLCICLSMSSVWGTIVVCPMCDLSLSIDLRRVDFLLISLFLVVRTEEVISKLRAYVPD